MRRTILLFVGLYLLCIGIANAQNDVFSKDDNSSSKHSVYSELLGRTIIFGSINYEYTINDGFSIGAGLGVNSVLSGQTNRINNGETETGKYFDTGSAQMLFANYFRGNDRHKLFFTIGITNFLLTYRNIYPSETIVQWDPQLEWNAGLGYQFAGHSTFLRASIYCISMPDPVGWFPKYFPWFGLSVGYKFH
ncbi:MAG: hypothetical protein C0596_05950 [Marinilabiliales bacterium]|nr:MAG: hypothetical protein C0596_05950 [Marinilabiliales bacterium]